MNRHLFILVFLCTSAMLNAEPTTDTTQVVPSIPEKAEKRFQIKVRKIEKDLNKSNAATISYLSSLDKKLIKKLSSKDSHQANN